MLRFVLPSLLLSACGANECVELCKAWERWLTECDSTWEAEFPEEGWSSVDDCYDDAWGASGAEQKACARTAEDVDHARCY